MSESVLSFPTYDALGVRPLINCRGTYTIISGFLLLPEYARPYTKLRDAMSTWTN